MRKETVGGCFFCADCCRETKSQRDRETESVLRSDYNVFELEIQVILVDMWTTKIVLSAVLVINILNNRTSCVFQIEDPLIY